MATATNPDLFPTVSDPASHDGFESFKDEIQELIQQQNYTNKEVVAALARRDFSTSLRSLERRLRVWGIRRPQTSQITDELAEAVNHLFHHTLLNDEQIATRIINDYGLLTTGRQVRTIRTTFRWMRATSGSARVAQSLATRHHVRDLLNGPGCTFGREWFLTYLRTQFGYRARRLDVSLAQRQLDPEGVASRVPGLRKVRLENYVTSGPNFLWCMDGHNKFSQYGIEIYAAVDAYSRRIIWYYCGNSNRTAISVLFQYLHAVKTLGICPRFIRTDKGTETILLADCHFSLYIEAALREEWPEEDYQRI